MIGMNRPADAFKKDFLDNVRRDIAAIPAQADSLSVQAAIWRSVMRHAPSLGAEQAMTMAAQILKTHGRRRPLRAAA